MTRSPANSESHEDVQKTIMKKRKVSLALAVIESSARGGADSEPHEHVQKSILKKSKDSTVTTPSQSTTKKDENSESHEDVQKSILKKSKDSIPTTTGEPITENRAQSQSREDVHKSILKKSKDTWATTAADSNARDRSNSESCEDVQKSILKKSKTSWTTTAVNSTARNRSNSESCEDVQKSILKKSKASSSSTAVDLSPRNRLSFESCDDVQKSILKKSRDLMEMTIIEPSSSEEREDERESKQSTVHNTYESHRKTDSHPHSHHGTASMIERKKTQGSIAPPVMPTPTSTERRIELRNCDHISLKVVIERKIMLDNRIEQLVEHLTKIADNKTVDEMAVDVKAAYIEMLNIEQSYKWSTFYRSEDPANNYKWTFGSGIFFAMNIYTTIGYGSLAPETREGQIFVIVYAILFVPITLVIIRDLGQWILLAFTKAYAVILLKYRRSCGKKIHGSNEVIHLPISISVFIMIGFVIFMTVFVHCFDALSGPPGSGIDWFHSFYFCFISFSTIALGDVMPNNISYDPIVSILFFFGLPIMKVVNRMTYLTVENGAFGLITVIENRLESYWQGKQPTVDKAGVAEVKEEKISVTEEIDEEIPAEWLNYSTIHSIATFITANRDVYGGSFGKVNLRAADVLSSNEQESIISRRSHR
ncbi:Ion channel [Dictyocaulus viviparus]|uniref:Ion channel n=1 Tax=Dictyocaulus viviparus TaxID=29172 RepID=A0A0D8XHR5_DICVI|nr:Ion channel [Dictyocaulus viviparus]